MTDTTTPETPMESTDESSGPDAGQPTRTGNRPRREVDVWRLLAWGALAICSLLAAFALVQLYGSVTEAIDLWVEPRHQPLMHAAFNLVVLLGSLIGISLLVRELN
ncbi:hypothetical protein [Natrarchaeobaculum sulfurireducens]|uniref:DUF8060 domain-containing protein n=1 Tax=Natrarchaeobaculum sulfurireducens TaxID=2044521 RepID=A0A346PC52_9EURY|nr:hypothetical protein [Natrarchaeobaculum sulfurireducens]AXR77097.1 hypothetical protein AArc1_0754 [Natrarchaeobaculum sulfurireducens]